MKVRIVIDLSSTWDRLLSYASKFRIEHFLLLYFAIHMLQISFPSDGSMVFDEGHYTKASLATLQGLPANAEHPPLAKIISAIGIGLLGNNWFGWRFPQVLMQIAALYLFFLLVRRLIGSPWAFGATMLLAFDPIFFIHGGALLIDMPFFLFVLVAFELYFRQRYSWSAVSMGLAFITREFGVFFLAPLVIYHILKTRHAWKPSLKILVRYLIVAEVVALVLLGAYDLGFHVYSAQSIATMVNQNVVLAPTVVANETVTAPITTITSTMRSTSRDLIWNPIQHLMFIYSYHGPGGMVVNEPYRSYQYAWNWILPVHISPNMTLAFDPMDFPTYFRVDVDVGGPSGVTHYIPIWYQAAANPALWYSFWLAIVGLILALKRKDDTAMIGLIGVGLFSNYIPWVLISIFERRMGFNYYGIYMLPFIALATALFWKKLPSRYGKIWMALQLLAAVLFFIWVFPVHPMPVAASMP